MSEKMYPIPFKSLMNWIVTEYAESGEIFGIHKAYKANGKSLPIFGERIETPFGPAAGPNSQLAQNIIASYVAGARFFEVKTVQKMDGAELAACVPRPCILANDEGYNQEWSTELTVPQAMDEYIKAWCALKVLSKVYGLGDPNGFVFNMSVGYDLEGIKGEKVNTYLEGMMDATKTAIWGECLSVLKEMFPEESDYIDAINPRVSGSVTVSTLHGCPPDEIERIASYLISEKHLHTFVKCNPTILGYETARRTLDAMGYDYIVFDDHHFNEDLQWADAVPMFERLQALADKNGLEFGLKLSNTFPVDTTRGELPNDEMYMSSRARCVFLLPAAQSTSTATSCLPQGSGPSPWPPRFSSPADTTVCCRWWRRSRICPIRHSPAPTPKRSARCPPLPTRIITMSSPLSPCPPARATSRCPGSTASPHPVRAAAPSSRIFPSISSWCARVCTVPR